MAMCNSENLVISDASGR